MQKILEIKANTEEEAIELLKRENDIAEDEEFEVFESEKPKSLLGLIKTKGKFKIVLKGSKKGKIEEKIKKLLELMDLDLQIEIEKKNEKAYDVNLSGNDNGIIIGKKGRTLNSFEFLVNSLLKESKIEVDVEGFKEKRIETLKDLAKKMAERVIKTGKAIKLNSMPPRERKIIHEILNEYKELETYSEGRDPKRYVVIKLKK